MMSPSFGRRSSFGLVICIFSATSANADVVLASRLPNGAASSGGASNPAISADGRWVVFDATDLVPSDTDGKPDVYLFDAQTLAVQRLSLDPTNGNTSVAGCRNQGMTPDGRHVLMNCSAQGLVAGVNYDFYRGIFAFDRDVDEDGVLDENGETRLTLVSKDDAEGSLLINAVFETASISDDGRYVAYSGPFLSGALAGCNAPVSLLLHDRDSDTDGILDEPGAVRTTCPSALDGTHPLLSGDGSQLAFESEVRHSPFDTNNSRDVYRLTLATGTLRLVSVDEAGQAGPGHARLIDISADGDDVLYTDYSQPFAMPAGYTPQYMGSPWVLLRDITDGTLHPVSRAAPEPLLGRTLVNPGVGFDLDASGQTALIAGPGKVHVVRRDTVWPPEAASGGSVTDAALDGSGDRFAVASTSALVSGDLNGLSDVYVVSRAPDLNISVTPVVGANPPTLPGIGPVFDAKLTNEGSYSAQPAALELQQTGFQIRNFSYMEPDLVLRGACEPVTAMAANVLHCNSILIDPGATWTIRLQTTSIALGTATLAATLVSAPDDVDSDDHQASASVSIVPGTDLEVLLIASPSTAVVGTSFTWWLGVINRGVTYTATNTHFTFTAPASLQATGFGAAVTFDGGCTIVGATIDCHHAALAPGQSVQAPIRFTGLVVGAATAQVSIGSDVADSDPSDNAIPLVMTIVPAPAPPPPPPPASDGGGGASDLLSALLLLGAALRNSRRARSRSAPSPRGGGG